MRRIGSSVTALVLAGGLAVCSATTSAGASTLRQWKQRNLAEIGTFNTALIKAVDALNSAGNTPTSSEFNAAQSACNKFGYAVGKLSHVPNIPNKQAQTNLHQVILVSLDMALSCVGMFKSRNHPAAFTSYASEVKTDEDSLTPHLKSLYSELGLLNAAPTLPTSTTTTSAVPGIVRCSPSTMAPVIRPTTIYFGCASGDISMTNISWQSWDTSSAIGTGTLNVNSCQPNCASGQEQTYAATLDVSDPGTINGESVFQQVEAGPTGFSDGPAETGSQPGEDWGTP